MLLFLTSALCLVFLGVSTVDLGRGMFGRGTGKGREFGETEVGGNKMGNFLRRDP